MVDQGLSVRTIPTVKLESKESFHEKKKHKACSDKLARFTVNRGKAMLSTDGYSTMDMQSTESMSLCAVKLIARQY